MASIDVVIPNYQYGHYLRDCVDSVLSQGVPATRVLIVDNASTDGSVEVAQELAREDPRVELVARRRNLGSHASFNEGLDWARADCFMVLCADDLVAPGAFARALAVMDANPGVGLAHGRALRFGEGAPVPAARPDGGGSEGRGGGGPAAWHVSSGAATLERICRTGFLPMLCCATLTRTEVHKRAGYYRPSLPHTDDFELWLRMACLADVAGTEAVQGMLRVHRQALSRFTYDHCLWDYLLYEETFASFFSNEGGALPDGARLRRRARRGLAARAYWSAVSQVCQGKAGVSRELFGYALRRCPEMAVAPPLGYLLRRDDALARIRSALAATGQRARAAALGLVARAGGRAGLDGPDDDHDQRPEPASCSMVKGERRDA